MLLLHRAPLKFLRFLCALLLATQIAYADDCKNDAALRAGLAPHKALYDIKLVKTKSESQIVNIHGQMFYEWHSTCAAWVANHRFDVTYDYVDGPTQRITNDFSTYETVNGREMDFTTQRTKQGQVFEELRGKAKIDEGGESAALYSVPQDFKIELPEGAIFPMAHTIQLIDAINRNETFYNATIFDGGDDNGAVNINAFIGKEITALDNMAPNKDIDLKLLPLPARRVQLAFFPLNQQTEAPEYEMDIVFHENGVISEMLVEYKDFSIFQTLRALEAIEN